MKKNIMKFDLILSMLCMILLSACAVKDKDNDELKKEQNNLINSEEASQEQSDDRIVTTDYCMIYEPEEQNEDKILTWAIWTASSLNMNSDILDAVNENLKKNGVDFSLRIVRFGIYEPDDWGFPSHLYSGNLDRYEKEYGVVDIINSGSCFALQECESFLESGRFEDLTDYLLSEEGKKLYEQFDEKDWEANSVNGKYYSIPMNVGYISDDTSNLYFNEKYIDNIDDFDGSFEKLWELYENYGKDSYLVFLYNDFLSYLLDYEVWNSLLYDKENNRFIDVFKDEKTADIIEFANAEHARNSKFWVQDQFEREMPDLEDTFAIFQNGQPDTLGDDFICYQFETNIIKRKACTNGVRSESDNKEAAIKVLELVYSTESGLADILSNGAPGIDYIVEDGEIKFLKEVSFHDISMNENAFVFGTFFFSKPTNLDDVKDRRAEYKRLMDGYKTSWATDFYAGLTQEESQVLGAYFATADSYLNSIAWDFEIQEHGLEISSLEELEARMEPIIEKLNKQLELQFGEEQL